MTVELKGCKKKGPEMYLGGPMSCINGACSIHHNAIMVTKMLRNGKTMTEDSGASAKSKIKAGQEVTTCYSDASEPIKRGFWCFCSQYINPDISDAVCMELVLI